MIYWPNKRNLEIEEEERRRGRKGTSADGVLGLADLHDGELVLRKRQKGHLLMDNDIVTLNGE